MRISKSIQTMIRKGWRPRSLSWRMMVSYFLVTVVAALTIQVATTIGPFIQQLPHTNQISLNHLLVEREVPLVAPYLEQATPDRQALQNWLSGPLSNAISISQPSFIALVGQRGQVLAAVSCSVSEQRPKQPGQCSSLDEAQARASLSPSTIQGAMYDALKGDQEPIDSKSPVSSKQMVVSVPVQGENGQILGALIVFIDGPLEIDAGVDPGFALTLLVRLLVEDLRPVVFYFVLMATIMGTLTGVLISRGVTSRLRRITQAATAWSGGDFQVAIRDTSRDELGRLAQDLNRMAEQVRTLLVTQQELAVIEERNRLARDLHDSIKQNVFATALLVGAARAYLPPDTLPVQTYLADAEELAEQTRQELTALIRELRPARLNDKGLVVALRSYTEDWSRRMGIAVALQIQDERIIALDIEEALFRVAQEALANIARHSRAEHVTIQLAWEGAQVRLTITDDGIGFDVAHAKGHGVGLASMRERMAAHNGTLKISNAAGATTVEATLPLHEASKSTQEATR